jgi:hypothetical protein
MPLFDRPPIDAISASDALFSSGTFRMTGGPGVTIGSDLSGATFKAGAALGAYQNFAPNDLAIFTTASAVTKTPFYYPLPIQGHITVNSVGLPLSLSAFTGTALSATIHWGLYTRVNSTSANLLGSVSDTFVVSSASSASASGLRAFYLTSPSTNIGLSNLVPDDYIAGFMISATAAGAIQGTLVGHGSGLGFQGRLVPGVNQYSTGSTQGAVLTGRGSTTVGALPATLVASDLWNVGASSGGFVPWTYLRS